MIKVIFGQGLKRADIADNLQNQTFQTMVCLTQLYLYPNSNTRHHWLVELWNKYPQVPKFSRSKKWPDKKFILRNTIYTMENFSASYFVDYVEAKEDEAATIANTNLEELESIYIDYFDWLSTKLDRNQRVTIHEVDSWLKQNNL